jgi:hypothetical protein
MKNHLHFIFGFLFLSLLFSCNSNQSQKIDTETYSEHTEKGNTISNLAQGVLLANVSSAMQKGGPEYAIEFCNLEASSLIDSLSAANNCNISRVSAKNRNPGNALGDEQEKALWNLYEKKLQSGTAADTLILNDDALAYYKPIKTAMPACLNCHGTPGSDIAPATLDKIQELYPNDKATGYNLNEFRGLWKITFSF